MKKTKMVCPLMDTCAAKPIWNKPVWNSTMDIQEGIKPVNFGHCIPHYENSHCVDITGKCPACVPFSK